MGQWHRDGVYNVVPAIVFLLLDTLALVLRCFAKRKTKARFGSDDAWIVIAGVQFYVWISLIIQGEFDCLGRMALFAEDPTAASLEGTIDPMNLYFKVPDDDNTRVMEVIVPRWLTDFEAHRAFRSSSSYTSRSSSFLVQSPPSSFRS